MTDFMTPRGHMASLVSLTKSATPLGEVGVCPLTKTTLQLLPVRYGLVEEGLDPSADMAMPYTLQSRPLGLRLMRDGFLYVLDNADGIMRDYGIKDGSLDDEWPSTSAHPKPLGNPTKMIFSRRTVLYVAYSEVEWTTDKCHQVMNDLSEREQFMQRVDLSQVHSENIVAPLIHQRHAKKWLAEVVRDHQPPQDGISAEENLPYQWEHAPLYRQTWIEELTSQVRNDQQKDFLFLAVRDDIGVMRDLASYQNKVVGWIDEWAQSGEHTGDTERDYLLGCYIESLSQISAANLKEMAQRTDDPELKALLLDLDKLPEPQRQQTRQALLDVLSLDPVANPLPDASDSDLPADLKAQLEKIQAIPVRSHAYLTNELKKTVDLYFFKQRLATADPDFVFTHWQTLSKLHREQDKRLKDLLYGTRFGQRGINDLIDRPRMDAFLAEQRPKLVHWNALLDRITEDRLQMLVNNRFQRAAWFYDTRLPDQIDHALLTQYDCLKDLCRSDIANDRVLAWLNANPQQSRPLFFTLPHSVQTELGAQFALFINGGYGLLRNAPESIEKLRTLFAGHLPDIDTLPHATQVNASAAWGTLSPAVQSGVQSALQDFMQALDKGQMPDIDQLFRYLPNTFAVSLLDAARREKVSFQIADAAELKALGELVRKVQTDRRLLRHLNNDTRRYRRQRNDWQAQETNRQRLETQQRLNVLEQRLAQMLSPIAELPEGTVHVQSATSAKPGLALMFAPEQQPHVRSVLNSFRQGARVAPAAGLLGDGVGLLVFAAQLVNFVQVWKEVMAEPEHTRNKGQLWSPFFTTAAAGFGAAQGIADTALSALAADLAENLKVAELEGVHVQMGKLHIGLGIVGYGAGMFASAIGLNSARNNWLNAARQGNSAAQSGAALSMISNSGFLLSNTYGLTETAISATNVLSKAVQSEARRTAWALAGTRLSKVFFQVNLAGILFTTLDLAGTWFYNRHNLSRHDRWLEMTPWSQNPNKRLSLSLSEYQENLHTQVKAPRIEVHPQQADDQGSPVVTRIALHLPTTALGELMRPFGGGPAKTVLRIGSYDLRTHLVRPKSIERWTVSTDALRAKLWIRQTAPLILEFEASTRANRPSGTETDELVITIELGDFIPREDIYELTNYHYRIPLNGFAGEILDNKLDHQGDKCTFYWVDPLELAQADNKND
jgi:hypothetical protein